MERLAVNARAVWRVISAELGTNMYVMTEGRKALVIDPHTSKEAVDFLLSKNIETCTIFLTHEHLDHVCGIFSLQQEFETQIICQKHCAESIADKNSNNLSLMRAMLSMQDSRNGTHLADDFINNYEDHEYEADIVFNDSYSSIWNDNIFTFTYTPGHSKGSCCILWNDCILFSGDSLLKIYPVITRLPGGSTKLYNEITLPYFRRLNKNIIILPGHGQIFTLGEI